MLLYCAGRYRVARSDVPEGFSGSPRPGRFAAIPRAETKAVARGLPGESSWSFHIGHLGVPRLSGA